jgi:hypothetical protein
MSPRRITSFDPDAGFVGELNVTPQKPWLPMGISRPKFGAMQLWLKTPSASYSSSYRGAETSRRIRCACPKATAALGGPGISRFPREVLPYLHGVFDRAGLWRTSRYRGARWSLPLSPPTSESRSDCLTRLNTRPARSPVNASTPPLRAAPHDSGSMWVAIPLSYDTFIHYTSPV